MTYMKLVTGGVKRHLAVADQYSAEFIPLCGCTVTRSHSWKLVDGLEGDECQHCAEVAFDGSAVPVGGKNAITSRPAELG